jgi:S1-C subfamily serine protease
LMHDGRVRRAYIGIAGGPRPLPPHARLRLDRSSGIEVIEVAPGSPAERAGLRAEDLIVELAGTAVERVDDIQRLMTEDLIGERVDMQVLRGDRWLELELRPVELTG